MIIYWCSHIIKWNKVVRWNVHRKANLDGSWVVKWDNPACGVVGLVTNFNWNFPISSEKSSYDLYKQVQWIGLFFFFWKMVFLFPWVIFVPKSIKKRMEERKKKRCVRTKVRDLFLKKKVNENFNYTLLYYFLKYFKFLWLNIYKFI